MHRQNDNGKQEEVTVGTRYPLEKVALLDAVRARRRLRYRSQLVEEALDRLLKDEGFDLPEAA